MRIMLLGANGQVGWELRRSLSPLGELKAFGRNEADFEDLDSLANAIRDFAPNIIVNAAAFTAVDKAETEPERAQLINSQAVKLLAMEAKRSNAWLLHYSTDYVFDGTRSSAYLETDEPNPQSVYGSSKLAGEQAIIESDCQFLIFRTSWVYAARGSNFAKTMIRLAKERDQLKVVSDQIGAPTSAELIADVTAICLYNLSQDPQSAKQKTGIYHLVASGETSWHGFAKQLITEAQNLGVSFQAEADKIFPISTSEYPLPAKRPANSRLDTQKISNVFGLTLPHWQLHVKRTIEEIISKETV